MTLSAPVPTAAALDAARLLLAQMGMTPADLVVTPTIVPTFDHAVPLVLDSLTPGTRRTYGTHLNRMRDKWRSRRLDEPAFTEFEAMAAAVKAEAAQRPQSRSGRGAVENFVGAARCLYKYAEGSGWLRRVDNPVRELPKPRRHPSHRYAIPSTRLAEICHVAATTGNDPELDALLLRLHTETACRVGGALALRPRGLDPQQCLIHLREKGETERWQPVSPTLMRHLLHHAETRHSPIDGQLLRYRNGRPITRRRYDHLWNRIGEELPWVALQGITAHWLRHTTLTWVERMYGPAVARGYAGNTSKKSDATETYVKPGLPEISAALATLTGEAHPLVPGYQPRHMHESHQWKTTRADPSRRSTSASAPRPRRPQDHSPPQGRTDTTPPRSANLHPKGHT